MTKPQGSTVTTLVVNLRRKNYGWDTIAVKVREKFPAQQTFTAERARMIWAAAHPRDYRPDSVRKAVTISLAGPPWSHPQRKTG